MKNFLDTLLKRIPPDDILVSSEQAIQIAKEKADKMGWPWIGEVNVKFKPNKWIVHSNYTGRGVNVTIEVDAYTGDIKTAGFGPR